MEFIIQHQVKAKDRTHTKFVRLGADRHLSFVITHVQASRYPSEAAAAADIARFGMGNAACILPAPAPAPAPARQLAGTSGPLWSEVPESA